MKQGHSVNKREMSSNGGWASLVVHECTYIHILEQTIIWSLLSYIISLNSDIHFAGWLFFLPRLGKKKQRLRKSK